MSQTQINQDLINNIIDELKAIELTEVIFPVELGISNTGHHLFTCFGVSYEKNRVAVLDGAGKWHEVEAAQANVHHVLSALLLRIKNLRHELSYV
jgi:hypothetical protein